MTMHVIYVSTFPLWADDLCADFEPGGKINTSGFTTQNAQAMHATSTP